MFYALLVAITGSGMGLLILTSFGAIKVPTHTFPVVGTIIGSFIFGIGMYSRVDVPLERGIVLVKDS